jgi:hypothetical protein
MLFESVTTDAGGICRGSVTGCGWGYRRGRGYRHGLSFRSLFPAAAQRAVESDLVKTIRAIIETLHHRTFVRLLAVAGTQTGDERTSFTTAV